MERLDRIFSGAVTLIAAALIVFMLAMLLVVPNKKQQTVNHEIYDSVIISKDKDIAALQRLYDSAATEYKNIKMKYKLLSESTRNKKQTYAAASTAKKIELFYSYVRGTDSIKARVLNDSLLISMQDMDTITLKQIDCEEADSIILLKDLDIDNMQTMLNLKQKELEAERYKFDVANLRQAATDEYIKKVEANIKQKNKELRVAGTIITIQLVVMTIFAFI